MVSAQHVGTASPLTCTKETKGSLKAFKHVRILLFQSVTEGCMLDRVPFPMHGFKSSSSFQFLILGYFLEAHLHTSSEVDLKKAVCDLRYTEPTKWSSSFHPEPTPYCSAS